MVHRSRCQLPNPHILDGDDQDSSRFSLATPKPIPIASHRNARPLDLALWKYHFEDGRDLRRNGLLSEWRRFRAWNRTGLLEPGVFSIRKTTNAWQEILERSRNFRWWAGRAANARWFRGIFRYRKRRTHSDEEGWLFFVFLPATECPVPCLGIQ